MTPSPAEWISAGTGFISVVTAIVLMVVCGLAVISPDKREQFQPFISPFAFFWALSAAVFGVFSAVSFVANHQRGISIALWSPLYLVGLGALCLLPQSIWFKPIRTDCRAMFLVSLATVLVWWFG